MLMEQLHIVGQRPRKQRVVLSKEEGRERSCHVEETPPTGFGRGLIRFRLRSTDGLLTALGKASLHNYRPYKGVGTSSDSRT